MAGDGSDVADELLDGLGRGGDDGEGLDQAVDGVLIVGGGSVGQPAFWDVQLSATVAGVGSEQGECGTMAILSAELLTAREKVDDPWAYTEDGSPPRSRATSSCS